MPNYFHKNKNLLIFVFLSIAASGLNYLAYPFLAHILPSAQYVNITVALSLFTQIATFLASSIAITIGLTKTYGEDKAAPEIEFLQKILFKIFAVIIVIFLLASPFLSSKLHIPLLFNIPISLMMAVAIPLAIISGFFNGRGKLIQLGSIAVISAGAQLSVAAVVALATKNGIWTMVSMALAQVITIAILYTLYRNEGLPKIFTASQTTVARTAGYAKRLAIFTAFSSVALLLINILQIGDLLIIKAQNGKAIKFYTDIYIISRIVFFAGTIFIWPFLAEISLSNKKQNWAALLKILVIFTALSSLTLIAMAIMGGSLIKVLFGSGYNQHEVLVTSLLSILYKLNFLFITSLVLYFTVFRSYKAILISVASGASVFLYSLFISASSSINHVLIGLDIISVIMVILSVGLLAKQRI